MNRGKGLINLGAAALRLLPPEAAHRATLRLLRAGGRLIPHAPADDSRLAVDALGLSFPSPLGLAAGFDKNGEVPQPMLKLGFGFVECGTVTPRLQAGNAKPRLFRLAADAAVINRMGFNNAGMDAMAARLAGRARNGILGINIGANKDSADRTDDYRKAFARLAPLADYVAVNVSSPNTPGLRGLQNPDELKRLLEIVTTERAKLRGRVPLLLKIAPDIDADALDGIADAALASGIEGIIATNTTIARPASLRSANARESGGLSGAPLFAPSTAILKALRARVGRKLVLIGVGGVRSGADTYAKIRAGADLVQLYTALAFDGPGVIARIKHDLLQRLARDGFANVNEAVGSDAK
ncbi:MAG: quinone-dependent dihydroorotate dehydrogenase [Rhizomicrobium sp.]